MCVAAIYSIIAAGSGADAAQSLGVIPHNHSAVVIKLARIVLRMGMTLVGALLIAEGFDIILRHGIALVAGRGAYFEKRHRLIQNE